MQRGSGFASQTTLCRADGQDSDFESLALNLVAGPTFRASPALPSKPPGSLMGPGGPRGGQAWAGWGMRATAGNARERTSRSRRDAGIAARKACENGGQIQP